MEVAGWCNGCGWVVVVGDSGCGLGCGSGVLLLLITPAGMVSGREGRANKVSVCSSTYEMQVMAMRYFQGRILMRIVN